MKIIYDFCQKVLGFVLSRYIWEFDSRRWFHIYFRITLSKWHCPTGTSAHGTHHLLAEPPSKKDKDGNRQYISCDQTDPDRCLLWCCCTELDICIMQTVYKVRIIHLDSSEITLLSVTLCYIINIIILNFYCLNVILLYSCQESTVISRLYLSSLNCRK